MKGNRCVKELNEIIPVIARCREQVAALHVEEEATTEDAARDAAGGADGGDEGSTATATTTAAAAPSAPLSTAGKTGTLPYTDALFFGLLGGWHRLVPSLPSLATVYNAADAGPPFQCVIR